MKRGRVSFNENGIVHEYDLVDPDALNYITVVDREDEPFDVRLFASPELGIFYVVKLVEKTHECGEVRQWLEKHWPYHKDLQEAMMGYLEEDKRSKDWEEFIVDGAFRLCGYIVTQKRVQF